MRKQTTDLKSRLVKAVQIQTENASRNTADIEKHINQCTEVRKAAQTAYTGTNAAVQSLGTLVSTLCGCAFNGDVSVW